MALESLYVKRDRLAGGLMGLLIGDALGVPYEFHAAANLPPMATLDFVPPPLFPRSHAFTPPGTWSDDGAQALCLLASLQASAGLDLSDFSQRLLAWRDRGVWAVDHLVFDVGTQTDRALGRLRAGVPPEESGAQGEFENGNGSLMRVLPLALWHQGSDQELMSLAAHQSLPTHAHPLSQVCCALYCLWVRAELTQRPDGEAWAAQVLRDQGPAVGFPQRAIEEVLKPAHRATAKGSGYVVDSLWSARVAFDQDTDYASVVRRAVAFGRDTDTTAAIAGGLAGVRFGLYGIPLTWRERLRGQALLTPLWRPLIERVGQEHRSASATVRTSQTHPLQIGTVPLASGGRVGITFCPGKKQARSETGQWDRDIDADLAAIRAWGATHLVTLIAPEEFEELGVQALPARAAAHGLHWHHAPILDGHIPGILPEGVDATRWFEEVWPTLYAELDAALARGESVVVHCKGGLGRAGTAACLLVAGQSPGVPASTIMDRVRAVRPNAVETVIQEHYLNQHIPSRPVDRQGG